MKKCERDGCPNTFPAVFVSGIEKRYCSRFCKTAACGNRRREIYREQLAEYHRRYYQEHKKTALESAKRSYQRNLKAHHASERRWKKNNPDKVRAIKRRHAAKKKIQQVIEAVSNA